MIDKKEIGRSSWDHNLETYAGSFKESKWSEVVMALLTVVVLGVLIVMIMAITN